MLPALWQACGVRRATLSVTGSCTSQTCAATWPQYCLTPSQRAPHVTSKQLVVVQAPVLYRGAGLSRPSDSSQVASQPACMSSC